MKLQKNSKIRDQFKNPQVAQQLAQQGGQAAALYKGARERLLTVKQANGLAKLSFLGYTDQSYNNMFFLKDGRVAILDTEPVKRAYKKLNLKSRFFRLFGTISSILTQQSLIGTAAAPAGVFLLLFL